MNNTTAILNIIPLDFFHTIVCPRIALIAIMDFRDSINLQDLSLANLDTIHRGLFDITRFSKKLTDVAFPFYVSESDINFRMHIYRYRNLQNYCRLICQLQEIVTDFENRLHAGDVFRINESSYSRYNRRCISIAVQRLILVRKSQILIAVMRQSENTIRARNPNFRFISEQWYEGAGI